MSSLSVLILGRGGGTALDSGAASSAHVPCTHHLRTWQSRASPHGPGRGGDRDNLLRAVEMLARRRLEGWDPRLPWCGMIP
jgi:hypothetical protein